MWSGWKQQIARCFGGRHAPTHARKTRHLHAERLEDRRLLAFGTNVLPDGSVEVTLDDTFDQFGFQPAIFQAYDATPENGFDDGLAAFSVFDTGASVVTIGANDQLIFSLLGSGGIPVQVPCGAIAEGVGGLQLVGHISERGTILADGLHVSSLTFDEDGFPIFQLGFHDPPGGHVASVDAADRFAGDATLSDQDDAYSGFLLAITSGPLRGQISEIADYVGATRQFVLRAPLSDSPSIDDSFVVLERAAPFVVTTALGSVADSTPSANRFDGDASLSDRDDFYEGMYLQFTTGPLAGEIRQVTDYHGATRTFSFADGFSQSPGADSFELMQITVTGAAITPGVQAFVGTFKGSPPEGCPVPASESLPTISGTPTLNPTPDHPNGLAVNVRPFGAFMDFSDFVGFEGLIVPVPDVYFQEPGWGTPHDPACLVAEGDSFRNICTDPIHVPIDFVGNMVDQDGQLTEAYNPVVRNVTLSHHRSDTGELVEVPQQTFLYDTGAQLSVISVAQATALGLDLNSPEDTISVQGAGGVISDLPGYRIESITVPLQGNQTLTFKNVWVFVLDAAPGILDGIFGMNLFNNAAALLYDPWHPDGPELEVTYFTESMFSLPFADVIEVEPNNGAAGATPVQPGQYGRGELGVSDVVDFWATPGANEGDLIFAYVDTQTASGSRDAVLKVYDKSDNLIASDDDDGPDLSPVVAGVPVPQGMAGTVFYEVREKNQQDMGEYAVYLAVVDPLDAAQEGENGTGANDSTTTAATITRTLVQANLGANAGSGDVDYYKITATEGTRLVAMIDNDPDRDGQLTATRIAILGPDGSTLFPETTGDGDGNAAAAGAVIRIPATGDYYVRVAESVGGADNDYRLVTLVLDAGTDFLANNLIRTAENRKTQAQAVLDEYEQALAACGSDINCQIDVLIQYQDDLLQASTDLIQAENVLTFAGSLHGSGMPTFVDVGLGIDISLSDSVISENGGVTTATLSRPGTEGDVTVTLDADRPGDIQMPTSVVIPDGQKAIQFSIEAVDNRIVDGSRTVTITASADGFEPGEVSFEITDFETWQNIVKPHDVDGDGVVANIDVLIMIDELNAPRVIDPNSGRLPERVSDTMPFYDVNGDGFLAPLDVLIVIDFLNLQAKMEGEWSSSSVRSTALVDEELRAAAFAHWDDLQDETDWDALIEELARNR